MNILVVSAHPDDETIGMGGTIVKLKNGGHRLYWLIMTRAFSPIWTQKIVLDKLKEVKDVEKFYGFEKVFHAKFQAASLGIYPQYEVVDEISKVINLTKPEAIYIPPLSDIHDDHQITANSTLIAARPQNNLQIKKIVSYEIPVTSAFSKTKNKYQLFSSFVNISKHIDKKIFAMSLYRSELMNPPHPRSLESIKIFARERGVVSGFKYSEAFSSVFEKEI